MSASNRAEMERRRDRDQAERKRLAMAENEWEESLKRDRSLFAPPTKAKNENEDDPTSRWMESLFGRWGDVKWGDSGNPIGVTSNRSSQRQAEANQRQSEASSSGPSQAKGQGKQTSHSTPSQGNSQHDNRGRDRYNNHHRDSDQRQSEKNNCEQMRSFAPGSSRSSSHSQKTAWHSSQSRSGSQGSSSSNKCSPVVASNSAVYRRATSPARDSRRELTHSSRSDHQESRSFSERRSHMDSSRPVRMRGPSTPTSSPPPNHSAQCTPSPDPNLISSGRTPPPHRRTPTPSHRTSTPVRQTPPVASHQTSPHQHTPPSQTQLDTKGLAETRPSLTLNIQREHKTRELDDIFKEMAVETPLTALSETPVKCKKTPRFMFSQKTQPEPEPEMEAHMQLQPPLSPLPEPELLQVKEEAYPQVPPLSPGERRPRHGVTESFESQASISEDLAVSDDSDMELEDQVDKSKIEEAETEKPRNGDTTKETNSSSEDSSSSEESSNSDSDDSSSESCEENEEVEEGEIREEPPVVKKSQTPTQVATTPPEKRPNESWALSQFIGKTSPASVVKGVSGEDVPKVKTSPRKMSEIGPCTTMPFIVHDDPIPRNSEKASVSPDTMSTASSHTSSLDTGKATLNGRKDSPPDPPAYAKIVQVSKQNTPRARGHAKSASSSDLKCESSSVKKECKKISVKKEWDETDMSSQQRNIKRTNSIEVKQKNSKSPPVTDASSEVDRVVTAPLEAKVKLDSQQQPSERAASPALSSASSKNRAGTKAKTSSRRDSNKSATRKSLSSPKESGESVRPSNNFIVSGTLTDIGSIIKDISVPQLLSPTIPSFSGEQVKSEPLPTMMGGKPSICVRLPFAVLVRSPKSLMDYSSTPNTAIAVKKECGATKVTSASTPANSVSDCNRESESRQLSAVSDAKRKTSLPDKKKSDESASSISSPLAKRKKEDTEHLTLSKRQKQPSVSSLPSPELNGVAHPEEMEKTGSKLPVKRRRSASSSSSHSSQTSKRSQKMDVQAPEKVRMASSNERKATVRDDLPFDSYRQPDPSPRPAPTPTRSPAPLPPQPVENGSLPSNDIDEALSSRFERSELENFLSLKAGEYKHAADKKSENVQKLLPYIRSLLFYMLRGQAIEQRTKKVDALFTTYQETLSLSKYVHRLRNFSQDLKPTERERILSVLILRIHATLSLKLYKLRRHEIAKLKRIIDSSETSKPTGGSGKGHGHAPSPHWNKNSTGTPSPMSPTPSPSCSIGSVESQGSIEQLGGNKMMNGGGPMPVSTIAVPVRIHSVTQCYVNYATYMFQGHDCWDLADHEIHTHKLTGFFQTVDRECGGPLNMFGRMRDLIIYVNTALKLLDTITPSS